MECQQFELYAAEGRVPRGREVPKNQVQLFVDSVALTDYWQRNFPGLEVDAYVRKAKGTGSVGGFNAGTSRWEVEMGHVHLCELFMLHELTHVAAKYRYQSRAHDPWFARTYLELVFAVMGSEAYSKLVRTFTEDRIDYALDCSVPAGRIVL